MLDKVTVVTPPDDFLIDGTRLLLVDLEPEQTKFISDSLLNLNFDKHLILYFYQSNENIDWFIDKKHKSDIIIFNAESTNDLLVGYLAAQSNSFYFGTLKILNKLNNSAIYSSSDFIKIFEGKS